MDILEYRRRIILASLQRPEPPIYETIVEYRAIINTVTNGKPVISSGDGIRNNRAVLLTPRSSSNSIEWGLNTVRDISSNYSLPRKQSNHLIVTINNKPDYYVTMRVFTVNGTTYNNPLSLGWQKSIDQDLSSYTGDDVWVGISFKFNLAGNINAILYPEDYTITWR